MFRVRNERLEMHLVQGVGMIRKKKETEDTWPKQPNNELLRWESLGEKQIG